MSSIAHFPMSHDPRDPIVQIRPDADPWIELHPGILANGAMQASIHRARVAQKLERSDAIEAALPQEAENLRVQELLDSVGAQTVARVLPRDLSEQDRQDAAAVAIRLHDPRWQMVSRYEAAQAVLSELRKASHRLGWYAAESDLRALADTLAGVSHVARYRVWTGQIVTTARAWARAALGLLIITEER